jgi:hypothetical protein
MLLILIDLLSLTACGVLEMGIESGVPTTAVVKATAAATASATPTAATIKKTRAVPRMMTPTPTPAPSDALRVAFAREGDVWLWVEGGEPVSLTQTGDVGENSVRISDDGKVVAFARGRELWAIDSDGAGERRLVSEVDLDALEPTDPGVSIYRYDWVPGRHVIAFNTRLRHRFGVDPSDDLHLVDADTLERTALLAPGEGGHFYHSPDGSQIALVRSGTIDLVDADGGNRREGVLTYTPSKAVSEDRYYAEAVWAADGSALGVAIPPPDPDAQPAQQATVWHVPTDGRPGRLIANVTTDPQGQVVFSSDLAHVAYLQLGEGDSASLMIAELVDKEPFGGKTVAYRAGVFRFSGWAPGAQHFSFLSVTRSDSQPIQAQMGQLGYDPVPIESPADTVALDVRWVDASRYFVLSKRVDRDEWFILLGGLDRSSAAVASIPQLPGDDVPSYDFADPARKTPVVAVATTTPEPTPVRLPRPPSLRVVYVKDGDVWLWVEGKEAARLTDAGGVNDVKISGDGEVVAFVREGELWAVDDDGADERVLVSAADLAEMETRLEVAFPTVLNRYAWVPGTHTVAFNTRLDFPIGLVLNDDLHLVDADTLERSRLLAPGKGGEFTYSPDGRQVAVANGGDIGLVDSDGENWRDAFTHTPVVTYSEVRYYAQPVPSLLNRPASGTCPPMARPPV